MATKDELTNAITNVSNAVTAEATARAEADTALGEDLADEATARQTADNTLTTAISDEATARATAVTNEATARANADTQLETDFNTALATKQNVTDNALQTTNKNIIAAINEILTIASVAVHVKGSVNTLAELPATGDEGDMY